MRRRVRNPQVLDALIQKNYADKDVMIVEDEESASPAVKEALALKKKTDGGGAPGAFKEAGKDAGPSTPRSREAANTFAHKLLEIWIGRLRTQ